MKTFAECHPGVPYTRRITQLTAESLNQIQPYLEGLIAANDGALNKTHWFNGRHENLYLNSEAPEFLLSLIDEAECFAADILQLSQQQLRSGYWFNRMLPGDTTTLHRHDDGFELLSCVFYVTVPEGQAGELELHCCNEIYLIAPLACNYLFFDPTTPHRVLENRTQQQRLSIGMNFGLSEDLDGFI